MQYGLTSKQLRLYKFIKSYIAKKTISPSFDEMKKAVGLKSKSGVKQIVDQLENRKWITTLKARARSIRIAK
jgi:repressor LexA|tara:strand:- start:1042 stop:1257 length:216 start_codon:yes stop_codon:yes gene_type:complete